MSEEEFLRSVKETQRERGEWKWTRSFFHLHRLVNKKQRPTKTKSAPDGKEEQINTNFSESKFVSLLPLGLLN